MVKFIIIGVAAIVAIVAVILVFFLKIPGPDVSAYQDLEKPRISRLPSQTMLELTVVGPPKQVLSQAFDALYQTYFSLPGVNKSGPPPAPRLRFPIPDDPQVANPLPSHDVTSTVGLPVPDTITPPLIAGGQSRPVIAVWEYGETAEILHHGPYDKEAPTINALLGFVRAQGYIPAGIHEEEYILGPGVPGATPETYLTVIRYPVKPR